MIFRLGGDKWPTWTSFSENGEFVLLASSLLGSAFFALFKDIQSSRLPGTLIIGPISLLLIVSSAVLFSHAMSTTAISSPKLMFTVSGIVYTLSIVMAVAVLLIEASEDNKWRDRPQDDVVKLKQGMSELRDINQGADDE